MADFTQTPTVVEHDKLDYNVIVSETEDMKKRYYKMSDTPTVRYRLKFMNATTTVMNNILSHYNGQYAEYSEFTWTSVPAYIESGANLTGRWVDGSLSIRPSGMVVWNVEITFEKSVT